LDILFFPAAIIFVLSSTHENVLNRLIMQQATLFELHNATLKITYSSSSFDGLI